jgi:hypothetical protein
MKIFFSDTFYKVSQEPYLLALMGLIGMATKKIKNKI